MTNALTKAAEALRKIIEVNQIERRRTVKVDSAGNTYEVCMIDGPFAIMARPALAAVEAESLPATNAECEEMARDLERVFTDRDGETAPLAAAAAALLRRPRQTAAERSWEGAAHEYEEQARYARALTAIAEAEMRERCAAVIDAKIKRMEDHVAALKRDPIEGFDPVRSSGVILGYERLVEEIRSLPLSPAPQEADKP